MHFVLLILCVVSVAVANVCENGFYSMNGKRCVKVFEAKTSHNIAKAICKNYHNSTLASIETEDEMEFYKTIAFSVMDIKNGLWVEVDTGGRRGYCPVLNEQAVQFINCDEKHSFMCMKQSGENTSLESALRQLKEEMKSLSERINKMNETLYLNSSPSARTDKMNETFASSVLNRFTHISEMVDKCAVPVTIEAKPESKRVNRMVGETISLNCDPKGYPPPEVHWQSPDGKKIKEGSKLELKNMSRYQSGNYTCVANNHVGPPITETFQVEINDKSFVTAKEKTLYSGVGMKMNLSCLIMANFEPDVQWFKQPSREDLNTNEIQNSKSTRRQSLPYKIIQLNRTHFETIVEERINSHLDFGKYECQADNGIEKSSDVIEVKGSPPFDGKINNIQFYAPMLYEIETTFNSYSPVLRYKIIVRDVKTGEVWEIPLPPSEIALAKNLKYNNRLTLQNLKKNAEYAISVTAQNEFGWGSESNVHVMRTPYVCGNNVTGSKEWQYIVSHDMYGVQPFDKSYTCTSYFMSKRGTYTDLEVEAFEVTKRLHAVYNSRVLVEYSLNDDYLPKNIARYNVDKNFRATFSTSFRLTVKPTNLPGLSDGFLIRFRIV